METGIRSESVLARNRDHYGFYFWECFVKLVQKTIAAAGGIHHLPFLLGSLDGSFPFVLSRASTEMAHRGSTS